MFASIERFLRSGRNDNVWELVNGSAPNKQVLEFTMKKRKGLYTQASNPKSLPTLSSRGTRGIYKGKVPLLA